VTLVIVIVAAVLVLIIGALAYSRRPRHDAGVTSFRRHIDALSPESRREMKDRVRPVRDDDGAGDEDQGDDPGLQESAD
jgi:hypothetical protein